METKKKNRRIISKLCICFFLIMILVISLSLWLSLPGKFLTVKDNIQNADCILPLGGDYYFRFKKAVQLYNNGYAKNIVFSVLPQRKEGPPEFENFVLNIFGKDEITQRDFALMVFKYFGKDSNNIYFTDFEVTSTYEEALATRDFMLEKGFGSLILVTSTYHMRRAMMIFKSIFKGTNIKIYNCTADNEIYSPSQWWLKERDIKAIVNEYLSIMQNFIYHSVLKKKRTTFDSYY